MQVQIRRFALAAAAAAVILVSISAPRVAPAQEFADTAASNADAVGSNVNVVPQTISTSDFVTDYEAVNITAGGFLPGEEVHLLVVSMPENSEAFQSSQRARSDGTVTFPVSGSLERPAASYIGDYMVEITARQSLEKDHLNESFSVLPVVPAADTVTSTTRTDEK